MPASGDMCPKGWCALAGERQTLALHGYSSRRSSRGYKEAAHALDGRLAPGAEGCTGAVLHDMVQCCGARASDGARCGSAWECSRAGSSASYQAAAAMPPDLNDNAFSSSAIAGLRGRAGLIG